MVGCYTYPVTRAGRSLLQVPGQPDQDADHQLPSLDVEMTDAEAAPVPEDPFPEEDKVMDAEGGNNPAVRMAQSMDATWMRLVEQSEDVAVRQLTFVQPVKSRAVKHILPALSRLHAGSVLLDCPSTGPTLTARDILTTMTSGSSFKSNGRVEAEMGFIKKSIRTLISAGALQDWPLAARHLGERRLHSQTQCSWVAGGKIGQVWGQSRCSSQVMASSICTMA